MWRQLLFVGLLLFAAGVVHASEQYTFENAERLKPLVEWRDYGPDAFSEAITENKPLFVLLTAPSWCYWCQVYESEDYLFHPDMVSYLNAHTVPVYVDADKRQDLTRKYLEGGWPSTTVLDPSGERMYGYSGPRDVPVMLGNLANAVQVVKTQGFANTLDYSYEQTALRIPTEQELRNLILSYRTHLLRAHDTEYGGFGTGQKFPQGRSLDYALDVYEATGDARYLQLVERTLENQYTALDEITTNYNLFDPVEGGFHRYGTKRDWTPPHYEKMLYDNARLLRAYQHLRKLSPENIQATEVVQKTRYYVETAYYDKREGGFFSNTDVHGEDAYYAKHPRPEPSARVERTKYTDWNSEAILTYVYLYDSSLEELYREIADTSLTYLQSQKSDAGMYHYHTPEGERGVRGSLLDNAYALLAFAEGRVIREDFAYEQDAKDIADYMLDNLYDWKSGGFFERNSPDYDLYAPGEHIALSKPTEENGIAVLGLLHLYSATKDMRYLEAALQTQGWLLQRVGGLDRGYYAIKSAEYIIANDLLAAYDAEQATQIREEQIEDFWLDRLLNNEPFVYEETSQSSFGALLILALLVGILSILSPCTLSILPAYIAYALRSTRKSIFGMTVAFFVGLSFAFSLLGMTATTLGVFLRDHIPFFSKVIGAVLVGFGILLLFGKGIKSLPLTTKKPLTYLGAFAFGSAIGLSWTPCVGPILVSLLLVAATQETVLQGGILLFTYSIGLGIPLLFLAWYLQKKGTNTAIWRLLRGKELRIFGWTVHSTSLISGVLFVVLGVLIFSGALIALNQVAAKLTFQRAFFRIEELLMRFL